MLVLGAASVAPCLGWNQTQADRDLDRIVEDVLRAEEDGLDVGPRIDAGLAYIREHFSVLRCPAEQPDHPPEPACWGGGGSWVAGSSEGPDCAFRFVYDECQVLGYLGELRDRILVARPLDAGLVREVHQLERDLLGACPPRRRAFEHFRQDVHYAVALHRADHRTEGRAQALAAAERLRGIFDAHEGALPRRLLYFALYQMDMPEELGDWRDLFPILLEAGEDAGGLELATRYLRFVTAVDLAEQEITRGEQEVELFLRPMVRAGRFAEAAAVLWQLRGVRDGALLGEERDTGGLDPALLLMEICNLEVAAEDFQGVERARELLRRRAAGRLGFLEVHLAPGARVDWSEDLVGPEAPYREGTPLILAAPAGPDVDLSLRIEHPDLEYGGVTLELDPVPGEGALRVSMPPLETKPEPEPEPPPRPVVPVPSWGASTPWQSMGAPRRMVEFLLSRGERQKAEALLRRLIDHHESRWGPENPPAALLRLDLAERILIPSGRVGEARALAQEIATPRGRPPEASRQAHPVIRRAEALLERTKGSPTGFMAEKMETRSVILLYSPDQEAERE
jgi:hypothetical protein